MSRRKAIPAAVLAGLIGLGGCTFIVHDPYYPTVHVAVAEPHMAIHAETGIRWATDTSADIFWYGGYWYLSDGPYWYRTHRYGSGWSYIASPPRIFLNLTPSCRRHYVVQRHPHHANYQVYLRTHGHSSHGPSQTHLSYDRNRHGTAHTRTTTPPARTHGRVKTPVTPTRSSRGHGTTHTVAPRTTTPSRTVPVRRPTPLPTPSTARGTPPSSSRGKPPKNREKDDDKKDRGSSRGK